MRFITPGLTRAAAALLLISCTGPTTQNTAPADPVGPESAQPSLSDPREVHLGDVIQLTRDQGENAEAYWSFDSSQLIFQTKRPPYKCDQIMKVPADGSSAPTLVSTGKGRTTCAYFLRGDQRVIYSSTHEASADCPPEPDRSQGYVWPIYDSYNIYSANPDGSDLRKLTDTPSYDAEATVCAKDGSIIFTSTRDGDLDLYRMDADGKNVKRLTSEMGYDGGAFFSQDCSKIVWRASRPKGPALEDYKRLLAKGLVRPSLLEVFVANADGSEPQQVTYLGAATFAPYFHPSGKRILFSTNYPKPRGREFDIWAIDVDGSNLERITYAPGFDGFPMFSPDGKKLAFASNRNQAKEGETDVFVADWVEEGGTHVSAWGPDLYRADVAWLADDAREGRGVTTKGINAAADWLEARMRDHGVTGAFEDGFKQTLPVVTHVDVGPTTAIKVGNQAADKKQFVPASFSGNGAAKGRAVSVGYGIVAPELGIDDYRGKRVKGKVVVISRFQPPSIKDKKQQALYSNTHFKAFLARERGAVGVIFVDRSPGWRKDSASQAPLPTLELTRYGDVGIPVVIASRELFVDAGKRPNIKMTVDLQKRTTPSTNVVGVIRGDGTLPGAVVVGAHYDHLGYGHSGSLEPGKRVIHNGADDNASGTAGLLEVARVLRSAKPKRDVYLVAFTAEESGLLGSAYFVEHLPPGLVTKDIVAMLNMDMIGRLRGNQAAVLGGGTAAEWQVMASAACTKAGIDCSIGGTGYGPSDQTKFYAVGIPVLQFFSGAHTDYHKSTDDVEGINAVGGQRVAQAVADLALTLSTRPTRLTFQGGKESYSGNQVALKYVRQVGPPEGDRRSFGASLGTIPDYAAAGKADRPGVTLSGVREGSAADKAGMRRGDRMIKLGSSEIRSVQDFVFVLRRAKPGQRVDVVVIRDGKRVTLSATFGKSRRMRGGH